MRRFFARLANLLQTSRRESDLAREIESHLALLEEDFERRGLPAGGRPPARPPCLRRRRAGPGTASRGAWVSPHRTIAQGRALWGAHPAACPRSEERRVGKECRSRWSPYH